MGERAHQHIAPILTAFAPSQCLPLWHFMPIQNLFAADLWE